MTPPLPFDLIREILNRQKALWASLTVTSQEALLAQGAAETRPRGYLDRSGVDFVALKSSRIDRQRHLRAYRLVASNVTPYAPNELPGGSKGVRATVYPSPHRLYEEAHRTAHINS